MNLIDVRSAEGMYMYSIMGFLTSFVACLKMVIEHFAAMTTLTFLIVLGTWLANRTNGIEVHTVNLTNRPVVVLNREHNAGSTLRLCVDLSLIHI